MNRISLLAVAMCSLTFAACGGGDDGGKDGVTLPDAKTNPGADAAVTPDAPPATLAGIGQPCQTAMMGADCSAEANGCLTFTQGAATGFCTKVCLESSMFTTDANKMPGPPNPALVTGDPTCTAAYHGSVGTSACSALVGIMPAATGGFAANTTYTIRVACGIKPGANNECPGGLTFNAQNMDCRP